MELISVKFFGLLQAIFMADAGGAWDNAKKIVEVDLCLIALFFVYRSFYGMRIPEEK
ncbi:MAG: sodium/proton-translocating pyrophosphatase [Verrucomicrobia bacterium]|nr:sodium/proton-translocating pyrophosphatase [Verrucomicrobiota bacterium]